MMKKQNLIPIILILPWLAYSQFSPGKLSRYHAGLEGNSQCVKCHDIGKKEVSDGCQKCHTPLLERIEAKKGYHADKAENCQACHSDHNGRDFELVYWPKDIKNFDHDETGYTLSGKHRDTKCRDCHQQKNIVDTMVRSWAGDHPRFHVLDRTFLGLGTACLTCHEDTHKDEVSDKCAQCHNTLDWKKAADEFDHSRARFLLTGAHQKVPCGKCHKIPDNAQKVWQLTGMAYDQCGRCHEDPHKGSYGSTCERCHTTVDWKKDRKRFDHNATKYPLVGKHIQVACQDCHTPQKQGTLPKFDLCTRCHSDEHDGQFLKRAEGTECSQCHTVYGFKPTTFT
ncbi:MAG: cytochrome c3 family protein, partial [Fidelibacterota bacterium]